MTLRRFHLQRSADPSGISGLGRVAEGVIFDHTGQVCLCWLGERSSIVLFSSIDDLEGIHGHGGLTELVMDDQN